MINRKSLVAVLLAVAAPGWVDVGVAPGPPGRPGMSVGVRLALR